MMNPGSEGSPLALSRIGGFLSWRAGCSRASAFLDGVALEPHSNRLVPLKAVGYIIVAPIVLTR